MAHYSLAVGTHDPQPVSADNEADAIQHAVALVLSRYGADLGSYPQEVATLLDPDGQLVTRPSERIDEFVRRVMPVDAGPLQPGDTNAPDCNGD